MLLGGIDLSRCRRWLRDNWLTRHWIDVLGHSSVGWVGGRHCLRHRWHSLLHGHLHLGIGQRLRTGNRRIASRRPHRKSGHPERHRRRWRRAGRRECVILSRTRIHDFRGALLLRQSFLTISYSMPRLLAVETRSNLRVVHPRRLARHGGDDGGPVFVP